jgi:uridine kinase
VTLPVGLTVDMQPSRTTDVVVELVTASPARPLVIALDGPSAAGTSTLGADLGVRLSASVVAGDDFYRDMPEEQRWALTAVQGVEEYFDWQRLRHEVLEPLRAGRPARYRPFSWLPGGGLDERWVRVEPTPIIVLEGVYTARPPLRDLVDLAVLVETATEERQRRLTVRGGGNDDWWPRWGAAEDHYFTTICPRQSFDLVIPGA